MTTASGLPGFTYLADEISLSRALGITIPDPIRLFSLEGIGVDQERFIRELLPTFEALPWDLYDLKKSHVVFLRECFPDQAERLQAFHYAYHQGRADLDAVEDLLARLTPAQRAEFDALEPFRRRAIAKFRLTRREDGSWEIERTPVRAFAQDVGGDDVRSLVRIFAEAAEEVTSHPEFRALLQGVGRLVAEVRPAARELAVTMHQVSIVADYDTLGDNAPEGIHKDGADYIVSALVLRREGIHGGESRVYGPDKATVYLQTVLQPGQGIFQADQNSTLWHDITPIVVDRGVEEGKRDIFGFDINIVS